MKTYSALFQFLFFTFLFSVLSLGRSFSTLHLDIHSFPLYITEIVLAAGLPVLIACRGRFMELPKNFRYLLYAYFIFGSAHLFLGVLSKNLLVLKDMVYPVYMVFLPLSLAVFLEEKKLKTFLFVLAAANIAGILAGRTLIFQAYPCEAVRDFISQSRKFNFGLYYGFAVSFFIAMYGLAKSKKMKAVMIFFLSMNFYMIIILGVRAVWFASAALLIFYLLTLKTRLLKLMALTVPVFLVMFFAFFYVDLDSSPDIQQKEYFTSKAETLTMLFREFSSEGRLSYIQGGELTGRTRQSYNNMIWRLSVWEQSIRFGAVSPVLGRGFGVYPEYEAAGNKLPVPVRSLTDSMVTPCHNHLISIFMKMGALGVILFILINLYVLIAGLRYINKCTSEFARCFLLASLGAFIFWHMVALLFDVMESPPTGIFLWIIIGLIFAAMKIDRAHQKT